MWSHPIQAKKKWAHKECLVNKQRPAALCFFIITAFFNTNSSANEDFFADIATDTNEKPRDSLSRFSGFYQQHIKYGINDPDPNFQFERDRAGIWQVRSDLFVEYEKILSDQLSLQFSTKAEVEMYRWQRGETSWETHNERFLLRDAFIDWTPSNDHWLRFGHQLFAWGDSEALPVIDILSRRDQRELGQAELRDLREQIFAAQYSLPLFSGNLTLISTYRAGHNQYGNSDDEFYPYISLKNSAIQLREISPSDQFEFAARYDHQFNGGDISVVIADVNDNDFAIEISEFDAAIANLSQERIGVVGLAAKKVSGAWMLRGELAQFFNQPVNSGLSFYESDQIRGAFGIEYSGLASWFMSYEINFTKQRNVGAGTAEIDAKPGHALHIRHTALHSRFQQNLWYFHFLDDQGRLLRWNTSYEWSDSLTLGVSAVFYDVPHRDSPFFPFRHHDSVNFSTTINF